MQGTRNFSDVSKAAIVMSYASWESDGSNIGIRANLAMLRLSCSFCEECIPGSSAETTTSPPVAPTYVNVIKGSIATFRPTCFIAVSARAPAMDAPMAVSMATFSFTAHSHFTVSLNFAMFSSISVDGVPGYALATTQPAWAAPQATASLAESNFLSLIYAISFRVLLSGRIERLSSSLSPRPRCRPTPADGVRPP